MATDPPLEQELPVMETVVQQSILQQAEAAAAAQTDSNRPTRPEALLQNIDLITPDAAEDEAPPPAYGDVYGEIRNEKDGLGTSAQVADDGRVNIRINQLNRRLSQVFTPALRQQLQGAQESQPPPPPYIPPSLGGEEGVPPPPSLNVVIQVVGSRGDVQPFVALGRVLKNTYGHRVRLATHANFKGFVQENGLEFFNIGGDPVQLMAFMAKNPSLMPGFRSLMSGDVSQRRRDVAEYIQGCWRSCYEAGDGMGLRATEKDLPELSRNDDSGSESEARPFVADCIIANPPSFAHIHCAEKLGIPLHIMFTMPYSPTQAFPHPLANIQSSNADPQLTNFISYAMIELLSWQGLGDIINRFRKKCLGLDPVSMIWGPGMLQRLKIPHTYCWSPALIPKPTDWGSHISISGFYFLKSSNYTPSAELRAFLDAGPTPIYIGFGSIVLEDPDAMTELIFEAVRKTGQRVLLSKGWGGIGSTDIPNGVFMLDNVPHDWLFKQVSCVVHHGGAGTTSAGITAGRPTLVIPFFGDQYFWGSTVARAGAGPSPIPIKQLTADKLVDGINFCLKPESLARAEELATKIAAERGSDTGAQSFHQYLESDRLRCMLAPSRPAVWRIKRTQIRLSAFAACTLANANLLDFNDLKLFRAQEYKTDEGPWDPISGGFGAITNTFGAMTMGLAEVPSETYKAFSYNPSKSSRNQSQVSVPTVGSTNAASNQGGSSTPPTSLGQSRTDLDERKSLAHGRSPSNLSSVSTPLPNVESSPTEEDSSRSLVRSQAESGSLKNKDMLRHTGAHGSKGMGRFVKAAFQSPMDVSVNMTKGFHNAPKLWGDSTVRPQEQVTGMKSGMKAVGREFGFGMYDGITGLVMQPWKGTQKEGVAGFFKGFGKGIGGFVAKPSAALMGVLGHSMKGVHKEVQKLFGSNVQNYIVASRAAQGYEEWLQSSEAETQNVVNRWKLMQKYLKKKGTSEEMVRDILDAQQKMNVEGGDVRQSYELDANSAQLVDAVEAPTRDSESVVLSTGGTPSSLSPANTSPNESLGAADMTDTIGRSVEEPSRGDPEEDTNVFRAIQEKVSLLQRQQQEAPDQQAAQENLRQAIAASEVEAQRHAMETQEYEKQLEQVLEQSRREQEQRQSDSESEYESDLALDDEEDERFELANTTPRSIARKPVPAAGASTTAQRSPPAYDAGSLGGITRSEFEAQQQEQRGEKTAQEKTEEEIVMEYIKKQSLLELQHRGKGKSRVTAEEEEEDEDLRKALEMSLQNARGGREGEASGR